MKDIDPSHQPHFTFTTLYAGQNGIDLGPFRDDVLALENEWFPDRPVKDGRQLDESCRND